VNGAIRPGVSPRILTLSPRRFGGCGAHTDTQTESACAADGSRPVTTLRIRPSGARDPTQRREWPPEVKLPAACPPRGCCAKCQFSRTDPKPCNAVPPLRLEAAPEELAPHPRRRIIGHHPGTPCLAVLRAVRPFALAPSPADRAPVGREADQPLGRAGSTPAKLLGQCATRCGVAISITCRAPLGRKR
jgi:hypothetical protein